jgi:hypothetical protein
MRTVIALCLLLAGAASFPAPTHAQSETPLPIQDRVEQGDYTIHYSLFPSTFLTEPVAAAYGIVRAKNRAVLNVSVRHRLADGGDQAHGAGVSGRYSDLIQSKELAFREVKELGGLYYIAEFRHGNEETLRFDLKVRPEGGADQAISFTRKLYVDP